MKNTAFLILLVTAFAPAQVTPDGTEILKRVDEMMQSGNQIATTTMVIHGKRNSRSITAKSWTIGEEKSFSEYLKPARERGTKMLKLDDQLWMYSPQADRTIRIAGHMLRQSLMGSDLSYEDMMENTSLLDDYSAVVTASGDFDDRPCWILELTALGKDVSYQQRKIWVDQERWIILKEERYAKSGKLLKTTRVDEVFFVNDRWYPKRIFFKDELQKGGGTEFIIDEIEFDVVIPESVFTKAHLRQ